MYAKFGAFTRFVTIFVNFDANGLNCKIRFLKFLLKKFLNAQDSGELTGTLIWDLEVLHQTSTSTIHEEKENNIFHPADHTQAESRC